MADKKIPIGPDPAEAELVKRVETMMAPIKISVTDHSDSTPLSTEIPAPDLKAAEAVVPIDIFSGLKTAPTVPKRLLKPNLPVETAPIPVVSSAKERVPQLIASTASTVVPVAPVADVPPSFADALNDTAPSASDNYDVPPLEIDDAKSDAAIASIAASDSDELLAARDALLPSPDGRQAVAQKTSVTSRRRGLLKRPWFYGGLFLLALFAVAAVPMTRYRVAGLVYKQTLQVRIMDSKTDRPVSKAIVAIDGHSAITDAAGLVQLRLPVGPHKLIVSKQYYASDAAMAFVNFKPGAALTISLNATGRQVPIMVTDKLTNKLISGAEINVLNTSAKTDSLGKAVIVLPATTKTVTGTLTAAGFNAIQIVVQITDSVVPANHFTLTAAGKVYFLSNEQGTIDVVKTNLDGTGRLTVVKGTGKEDPNTTVLLASRDWRYSVLKAQRDSSQAALYLIDNSTDKLVQFDSGDANFSPIGWYNHSFMYDVVRNGVATSQNNHEVIKSYDAERDQLNQLDATLAVGEGASYVSQGFYNFYILDNLLVYNTQWYSSGGADLSPKTDTIRGVQPNGQNKKDYQTIPAAGIGYIQSALATPQEIYFAAFNYNDNKTTYYEFQDQVAKVSTTVTQASFNKLYPTYVLSPTGKLSAWSELRNGKQVVLVGGAAANGSRQAETGYSIYGWFGDAYLLVSKKGSELYIVPTDGPDAPIKLSDYYKSAQNNNGYGYGGL